MFAKQNDKHIKLKPIKFCLLFSCLFHLRSFKEFFLSNRYLFIFLGNCLYTTVQIRTYYIKKNILFFHFIFIALFDVSIEMILDLSCEKSMKRKFNVKYLALSVNEVCK